MKATARLFVVAMILLLAAHRLPAPMQEVPESPTPTPAPTLQPSAGPSVAPERGDPAIFAGNWTGKIKFGRLGDIDFTLVINSDATSLEQSSKNFGRHAHPTTSTRHTLSWRAGEKDNHSWALTPNPDGQTALTTLKLPSGAESTAIFQRVQVSSSPSPTPARTRAKAKRSPAY